MILQMVKFTYQTTTNKPPQNVPSGGDEGLVNVV